MIHQIEIHALDSSQKEDYVITSHPCEEDKNEYVGKACKTHWHDEKSRSMNTPETGYYETEVAELIISDDKELRQRFIIGAETIQQDSDTDVATRHRKIQDETRDSVQTSSNKNTSNGIKDDVKTQLSTVEPADSIDSCKNVTFLEIAVPTANEPYFVRFDDLQTSLEIVLNCELCVFSLSQ